MSDYLAIARQCGIKLPAKVYPSTQITMRVEQLSAYTERMKADERERCAKICETFEESEALMGNVQAEDAAQRCAAAIRQETKE